jgi:hypothetical protein
MFSTNDRNTEAVEVYEEEQMRKRNKDRNTDTEEVYE